MADLNSFTALMQTSIDSLEEQIGAQLLSDNLGMRPPDAAAKKSAARNWWRLHTEQLRTFLCESSLLRKYFFSPSEKDRNLAIALIGDAVTGPFMGVPAVTLFALTCHYGADKLCGDCKDKAPA